MKHLLGLLFFASATSYASISACATAATGTVLTGLNGSGNGCAAVDLSFENLVVSGANAGGGFVAPTLVNSAAYTTSTAPVGNNIATAGLTLNPITNGDWERTTGNNSSSLNATFEWVANTHSSGTYGAGTPYSQPNAGYGWFFDAISLLTNGNVTSVGAGNSITVTQTVCLNATTTASCAANALGTLTALYNPGAGTAAFLSCTGSAFLTCANGNATLDILNTIHVTQIAFSTSIALARNSSGTVDLNFFTTNFDQFADTVAPEPSTFGLMGAALIGLGIAKRRRRRR